LIGLVRGMIARDAIIIKLGSLTGVYFLLAFVYPAHQIADLVWMLVPLWSLAAIELSRYLDIDQEKKTRLAIASSIPLVFSVFVWLNLASLSSSFNNPEILKSSLLLMLGAMFIMILSMFLVAAVWEEKIAMLGIVWGMAIALILFTVSAGINASGLRLPFSSELYQPAPQFVQADLLKDTINDLSVWRRGQSKSLSITTLTGLDSPSLLWLLRDWQVEIVDAVPLEASPELVILPQGVELRIASAYRGQDFILKKTPIWEGLAVDGWLRWVAFRKLPEQSEVIVLWARSDLFLDGGAELDITTP
jgi:hypothetical protein